MTYRLHNARLIQDHLRARVQDFFNFVAVGSFAADGGPLQPTVCVNSTPQMTCFRGAKVCTKWIQGKVMMN